MSTYNKATDRNINGSINRKYTSNEVSRSPIYAKLKHLHFVLIQRHQHRQICREITLGVNSEGLMFNHHPHKPTRYDCCL